MSKKTEWSPVVPGTQVSRLDLVLLMQELYETKSEHMFRLVVSKDVLSVAQLASLMGVTRQTMYIKLLRRGIEYSKPPRAKYGPINMEAISNVIRVVKVLSTNPSVLRGEMVEALKEFGPPGIVYHLTGVDTRKGVIA